MRPVNWSSKFRLLFRPAVMVIAGLLLGVGFSQSLSGCAADSGSVHQLISAMRWGTLPSESQKEVDRFRTLLAQHVAEDDRLDDQMSVFLEAFRIVRAEYVHETKDADLVDAAIAGVRDYLAPPTGKPDQTADVKKDLVVRRIPVRDPNEPLSAARLVEVGLSGLLGSLDPHSSYLDPVASHEMRVSNSGKFGGLGIEVTMDKAGVKVVAPMEDTPAARAGLQAGDIITHADGQAMAGWTLFKAVSIMRGDPGDPIVLKIARKALAPFDVVVVRDIITVRAVRYRSEGDVGYIRVAKFSQNTQSGLEKAMSALDAELGDRVKGYVIDLRNNPGGLLGQSVSVSDSFLDAGGIVTVRQRGESGEDRFRATAGDLARGRPVVVLIGPGSASASEIVASAIQDNRRGLVMGEQSFGKGSVQTVLPLSNKGALRLTTALYYTPSNRSIQALGVTPDLVVRREPSADEVAFPKESDLPRAIHAQGQVVAKRSITVDRERCEPIKVGDREDRQLGCAVSLIRAGSLTAFLRAVGVEAAASR